MLLLRIKTFLKSLFFHIRSGLPKATRSEIQYRYSICIECDQYEKQKSRCGVCGCNIENKSKFLNKLAWADQECPIGKWPKINR